MFSRKIGYDISCTCTKLEQLTERKEHIPLIHSDNSMLPTSLTILMDVEKYWLNNAGQKVKRELEIGN